MDQAIFFWFAMGLGAVLFGLFLIRGKNQQPTRLKMDPARPPQVKIGLEDRAAALVKREAQKGVRLSTHAKPKSRHLNVHFNYNGHSWDAFEVLGVPAGAEWSEVEKAYDRAKAQSEPQSHEFLEMAFLTIQMHYDDSH